MKFLKALDEIVRVLHSKRGFFSNICKRLPVWLYFDGKCGLIRQTHIHNDYQLYTVKKNTGSENTLTYNEEKKGLERSKAGMDS